MVQIAAQRTAAHGQHGVVDGGAVHQAADGLELFELEAPRLEYTVRRHHRVEARHRQAGRPQQPVACHPHSRGGHLPHHASQGSGQARRRSQGVRRAARHHRDAARRSFGEPGRGWRDGSGCGVQVVQQDRDLAAALHVDGRVVRLGQQRKAAFGQVEKAVQALDDVDLPQRSVQVERPGVDARCLDAELPPVAGLGQRDVAHVVLEVEVLVVHPVGQIHVQRHTLQLLAKRGQPIEPALDVRQDGLEAQLAAGRRALVVDVHEGHVGVGVRRLGVQEGGVVGAELSHAGHPGPIWQFNVHGLRRRSRPQRSRPVRP